MGEKNGKSGGGAGTTTYRVTVYTGTADGAGTSANVYITLYGANGNSGERELDNGSDNFEKGDTDVFSLEMEDLGDINQVRIRHNNTEDNPGWFLDKIVVHNETTDREWTFPCSRWLATSEDDGQTERVLDAA